MCIRDSTSTAADWAKIPIIPAYADKGILPSKGLEIGGNPKIGDSVYGLGHGLGLPMKMVYHGKVNENQIENLDYFECDLDFFTGNSGSPIFDTVSHKVIGLLVRGEEKFDLKNDCLIHAINLDGVQEGEECQRLDFLKEPNFV